MPAVSFIIPTYNRPALLAGAVKSARQAGSDLEIIVVDDASTDDTPEVCKQLSGIRYIRLSHNQGLAAARNAGVLASSAEFVAFLDDDDLRLPHSINLQVRALRAAPEAALVYGRVLVGDSHRRLPTGQVMPDHCPQGDVFWELLATNFIPVTSVVARRSNLVEAGLFHSELRAVEDWDMWLRLSERFPFIAVEETVAIYRMGNSSSGQITSNRVYMFQQMLRVQRMALQSERARNASARSTRIRRKFCEWTYDVMVHEAACALTERDNQTAREHLRLALQLYPYRLPALWLFLRSLVGGSAVRPSGALAG
jgi:glycosyltransferase involved in cell wall biosynthesis